LAKHFGFVVADIKDNDVKNIMSSHGYKTQIDFDNAWDNLNERSLREKFTNYK